MEDEDIGSDLDMGMDMGMDSPDDDDSFEDFDSGSSLADIWSSSPLMKIGVIVAGVAAVVGGIILFGGGSEKLPDSRMRGADDVSGLPGTEEVSESYEQAVREANVQDVEKAVKEGSSSMPISVGTTVGRIKLQEDTETVEDPLERWRRIQEERQRIGARVKPDSSKESVDPNAGTIDALANAMASQMESILDTLPLENMEHVVVTEAGFLEEQRELEDDDDDDEDEDDESDDPVEIILPAGTIEYGQLITEANSDTPGPVLLQLVSGPLAGSRMLGSFDVEDDYLVLNFDSVVIDGVVHSTNAVAIDPATANVGLATEVDHRYFKRVILPAAAAFVEGMGSAVADAGSTDVSVSNGTSSTTQKDLDTGEELAKGVGEAASKIGEILDEEADKTKVLVRVHAGTPMGILFVEPVTDETE